MLHLTIEPRQWVNLAGIRCRKGMIVTSREPFLRPRVPDDPRSCQMDGRTISTNIDSWFSRSCKRRSDRVSGHSPMVLSAMEREINQLAFY